MIKLAEIYRSILREAENPPMDPSAQQQQQLPPMSQDPNVVAAQQQQMGTDKLKKLPKKLSATAHKTDDMKIELNPVHLDVFQSETSKLFPIMQEKFQGMRVERKGKTFRLVFREPSQVTQALQFLEGYDNAVPR